MQNSNYQELSSGEKQLVLLARALYQSLKFLLLDEQLSRFAQSMELLNLIIN